MVRKKGIIAVWARKLKLKSAAAIMALAIVAGMTPGLKQIAYAAPEDANYEVSIDGQQDENKTKSGEDDEECADGEECGDDKECTDGEECGDDKECTDGEECGDDKECADGEECGDDDDFGPEVIVSEDGRETTRIWRDDNGNIISKETEITDADGNVVSRINGFSQPGEDGAVTWVSMEQDGDGNMIKYVETMYDADGNLVTEMETVHNEDGSTTEITTYFDEEGNKSGSTEVTRREDGMETKTVEKDADGHVYETVVNKTEIDGDGNVTVTNARYDDEGKLLQEEILSMSADLKNTTHVTKDGDGKVLETIVQKVETNGDGDYVKTTTRLDGDGNQQEFEEVTMDQEGNVKQTITSFTMTEMDGNVTSYTTQRDANDKVVKSSSITKNEKGVTISSSESVDNGDGTRTDTETKYDENGNVTGYEESIFDTESGLSKKTVSKDANGNVTKENSWDTDGNGNTVITNVTYDGNGAVKEESVTTFSPDMKDISMVTKDGNGNVIETVVGHSEVDENGKITRNYVTTDAKGNTTEDIVHLDSQGKELDRTQTKTNVADRVVTQVDASGTDGFEVSGFTADQAKALCTAEELAAYEAGAKISLRLSVKEVGATITEEDKALVKKALQDKGLSMDGAKFFDLTAYKSVGGSTEVQVTDMGSSQVNMTAEVPADMINTDTSIQRTFYVVQVHGGVSTVLAQGTEGKIPYTASLFSVYAIGYHDEPVGSSSSSGSGSSGSSSGSGSSSSSSSSASAAATTATLIAVRAPKTGEENGPVGFLLLMMAASAGCFVYSRKK